MNLFLYKKIKMRHRKRKHKYLPPAQKDTTNANGCLQTPINSTTFFKKNARREKKIKETTLFKLEPTLTCERSVCNLATSEINSFLPTSPLTYIQQR
jgi:hypothetical protein